MARSAVGENIHTGLLLVMLQGKIVPVDHAKVSVLDRGLYFGDGVYEVIRSYSGKLWGFEHHMVRLERSLKGIEIENVDLDQVRKWVFDAFEAVDRADCLTYFQITRGCAARSHIVTEPMEPQFMLMVKPPIENSRQVGDGIAAITYPETRWRRCDIKSLNLLPNVMARRDAHKRGAGEAIFIDQGAVTEGAVSSIFAVVDNKLITRPLDPQILPGITRLAVISIAEKLGVKVEHRRITADQLLRAQEVLACGTGEEIRSVVKIDDHPIGQGRPGPVTRKIIDFFIDHTRAGKSFEDL